MSFLFLNFEGYHFDDVSLNAASCHKAKSTVPVRKNTGFERTKNDFALKRVATLFEKFEFKSIQLVQMYIRLGSKMLNFCNIPFFRF